MKRRALRPEALRSNWCPGTQYMIPDRPWCFPRSGSACHGTIMAQQDGQLFFPIRNGIPIMLIGEAIHLGQG